MWKKFCVAIFSVILLSGITIMSQQLLASPISTLRIEQVEHRDYYIYEDVPFHVSTSGSNEQVLYISGGNVIGNSDEYTIPLQEDSADFTLKNISKPGLYQGRVDAQVSYVNQQRVEGVTTSFSITLYGKAFQQDQYTMHVKDEMILQTYGTLPDGLKSYTISYTSSDEDVVVVDETGRVKALKQGTATIDVEVLDETGIVLSKSSTLLTVKEQAVVEVSFEKAIPGEEYEYRFVEMETTDEDQSAGAMIGSLHLGQSGSHTYYVDKEYEELIRIEEGTLYLKGEGKAGSYRAIVYAQHEESKKLYKIPVSYTIQEKQPEVASVFSFRYNGEDVKSIIHSYKTGANNFQIASNQAISDVKFHLKEESDSTYFTISQTGNVSIKKVTEKPIMIQATYKKEVYEVAVVIEKAEQIITQDVQHITLHLEDGLFEPIVKGRQGNGSLVLTSNDSQVASISSVNNQMRIQGNAVGTTTIEIFNNGDENFKKSNVLRFVVEVVENQTTSDVMHAQSNWLLYPQPNGEHNWYTQDVRLEINPNIEELSQFSYQGEWMSELTLRENGVQSIPITFANLNQESDALMLQVAIDTHAPMITHMSEDRVSDNVVKELINQATFQQAYGTGMKIRLEASDLLMDEQVQVSGVAAIKYSIYAIEDEQEELLLSGEEVVRGNGIEVEVDDTRMHKVCATAIDQAGLASFETCSILDNEVVRIASANSGIMLKGRSLRANAKLEVMDVLENVQDIVLDEGVEIQAALKLSLDQEVIENENYSIVIPLRNNDDVIASGVWKQRQEDGSYTDVVSSYEEGNCTLTTSSLDTLIYVQEKDKKSNLQSLKVTNTKQTSTPQISNVVQHAMRPSTVQMEDVDIHILLCLGGGVLALLFAIILLRANHVETYE